MRDLLDNIDLKVSHAPVVVADNTAQVGNIIDRRGFDGLTFAIALGTLADADATFAVTMDEGDAANLSDAAAVAAADIIGTLALAGFTFASDNLCRKVGYAGKKRYVRLTITPTGNSGNAPISSVAILSKPAIAPTVNPPV